MVVTHNVWIATYRAHTRLPDVCPRLEFSVFPVSPQMGFPHPPSLLRITFGR